ncbi:MAG: hypothetical protein CL910_16710 [Deltaproteobacteria bacterium]|nr:hypothetical protein [Deltaproteobacteria bacterium]
MHGAARVALLLAAFFAAFPSAVLGHALAASAAVCTAECDDASAPSPLPAPAHDESECSLCKAGGSVAPAPQVGGLALPLRFVAPAGAVRIAGPRPRHSSPEAARAPPHALFV